MIPYIGDVSKADAEVLAYYAAKSKNILEFGCGASTQIMSFNTGSNILSVDTEFLWIDKTRGNLDLLGIGENVRFEDYGVFMRDLNNTAISREYDFVFDDGADHLRVDFARIIWPHIKIGGRLAFHDTRRFHDFANALGLLAYYQNEIDKVYFNTAKSNITIIQKKIAEPYDNWQISENKEPWQLGYGEVPEEIKEKVYGRTNN